VYEVICETGFCATHVLTRGGKPIEPRHGHDWRVEAAAGADELDDTGLALDFERLRHVLVEIAHRYHYKDLNEHPDFENRSPSAEVVARHFFDELQRLLGPEGRLLKWVRVYEAPGCSAVYAVR
jgi:6-pyruvoyltetrahydropterin/6-carboxytetrahydropterin synthase